MHQDNIWWFELGFLSPLVSKYVVLFSCIATIITTISMSLRFYLPILLSLVDFCLSMPSPTVASRCISISSPQVIIEAVTTCLVRKDRILHIRPVPTCPF
ncbi:hypothetical protein F8M41_025766 [Gigaspora margarita]|uniref:Uncharacterized protein n=1 Tax=Gigaspora margarita TaxID=4874 RepID=A0A8H3XI50_GIGMA|nr:hypothetical protein F8M41_025766 [Gigaspora margarita]